MKAAAGKVASALAEGAEEPEEDDAGGVGEIELKAIKAFDKAATPEDRALALKSFVKACMAGGGY